jgi:hypothetical protein
MGTRLRRKHRAAHGSVADHPSEIARSGEMQFATQTDAYAMLDGGESVRTREIDAAETNQTLRIPAQL